MDLRLAATFALVTALVCAPAAAQAAVGAQTHTQGLVLEASLVGEPRAPEEPQVLRATLRNVGARPLEVLIPEHQGLVPFPSWVLTDEHGAVVRPEATPFQSMWTIGLQGEVLALAPGAEASYDTKVQLRPGRWTATCTLEQTRAEVPWGRPGFVEELRPWPTLWTGAATSAPVSFAVGAFTTPVLTLALPAEVATGAACPLVCDVHWPAAAGPPPPLAALEVVVGTKPYGSATSRWVFTGKRWAPSAAGALGALPPLTDTRWSAMLDLAGNTFRSDRAGGRSLELAELVGEGHFFATVTCVDGAGRRLFAASTDSRLGSLGAPTKPGLELVLRPSALGPRHVVVALRNTGTTAHRVPASLAYPRSLAFTLRREGRPDDAHWSVVYDADHGGFRPDTDEPTRAATLPKDLAWSAAAFERDLHDASTTVLLAPGGELARTVDLRTLLAGSPATCDGPLVVSALWRQRARGVTDPAELPLTVGALQSAPLALPSVTH